MLIIQLEQKQLELIIETSIQKALKNPELHYPPNESRVELLTVKEAGKFLSLSIKSIYGLLQKKQIAYLKPPGSKRIYFSKDDLIQYLESGRRKTNSEIAAEADQYLNNKKGLHNGN